MLSERKLQYSKQIIAILPRITQNSQSMESRVTVLGGASISECACSLLRLRPSFSPSQPISVAVLHKIACSLQDIQDRLRSKGKMEGMGAVQQCVIHCLSFPSRVPFLGNNSPTLSRREFSPIRRRAIQGSRSLSALRIAFTYEERRCLEEVRELLNSKT